MKWLLGLFSAAYSLVALLFGITALWLLYMAATGIWEVVAGTAVSASDRPRTLIIESIGLLAVALVALEIAQTIVEEQVIRQAHVSAPTRARRYLSRFFVVLTVAMTIEMLVVVVKSLQESLEGLRYAAWIGFATASLLVAWGLFVKLNRSAEEIEPEAMREAKQEDEKLKV